MPSLGPLIPRNARWAGLIALLNSLQFIVVMIAVQIEFPGYSASADTIGALGASPSPWATVFNASVILLGVLVWIGTPLLASAFARKGSRTVGLGFLLLAGLGAILVGVFPTGSPELGGHIHGYVTGLAFVSAAFTLLVLPVAMLRDTRWAGLRSFTFLLGIITGIAIILHQSHSYLGLGQGGMERIVVFPILLWSIAIGIHLLRLPTYQPAPIVKSHSV